MLASRTLSGRRTDTRRVQRMHVEAGLSRAKTNYSWGIEGHHDEL